MTLFLLMIGIVFIPKGAGWMMYLTIFPYTLSGIVDPAIRTLISRQTAMNEQGELQGVFTSLMSLGEIIGPPLFMWIYYTSRKSMPQTEISFGTPFLAASLFAFLAFILVRWTLKDFVKSSNNPDEKV